MLTVPYWIDELLKIDVHDMDINELVNLVASITGCDLHTFPDGAVILQSFSMYASPYGATIGEHIYNPGLSADLTMNIFSHHLQSHLRLDRTGFFCQAALDRPLSIGPLSVGGYLAPYPQVYVELSASHQRVSVDGQIKIGDLYCSFNARLTVEPTPTFFFSLVTDLFGAYKLTLVADLNSPPADWQCVHCDTSGFSFSGDFSEEACSYLCDSVKSHLSQLGPNAAGDRAEPISALQAVSNSRLRIANAARSLRGRLAEILRAYAQRKEALRKLSNQRSSAFSYYWTDLQNARARLDAMQRKYDAELKNKLFVLRQAQAKAGRDARGFKVGCCMALPPSRALIVVPTAYTRS